LTEFTITFHGPFHIGSGVADQGLDRVLDHGALLPGTSLKGVMRAAASETLKLPRLLVAQVFGGVIQTQGKTRRVPSPWAWSDADLGDHSFQNLARIRIDDETRTTERGFLMLGESVWATSARFTVTRHRELVGDVNDHLIVLRASARTVTGVGGGRRRGEGWVSIADGATWSVDDTQALRSLGGDR
jgi:CRISPR/Cas system CSM-associated protein Csm3 (group 7 of RAMP superfamily)